MTSFSLYDRSKDEGTITEPEGIPDPIYTLPSTTNWMRALAMIVKDEEVNFQEATDFFSHTSRMPTTPKQENSIFEHLLLAVHQLSALRAMQSIPVQSDVARVASVAWYYGIYAAGTAMVAAQDGSLQDNHTQTAKSWDNQFALRNKVLHFFDLRVSTLVKKNAEVEID